MANASAQQKDPDFDFRKNLIGNLGDDFVGYQKAAAGTSIADLNNAPSIFLFAAANPDQALQAVTLGRLDVVWPVGGEPTRVIFSARKFTASRCRARLAATPRYLYLSTSGGYVDLQHRLLDSGKLSAQ